MCVSNRQNTRHQTVNVANISPHHQVTSVLSSILNSVSISLPTHCKTKISPQDFPIGISIAYFQ